MKEEVKINLGSGPDGIEGWVNFDWGWLPFLGKFPVLRSILVGVGILSKDYVRPWSKIVLHDLRKGIPLPNSSVDWIYNSNFIEHLEKFEAENLLKESLRVLKTNGQMRLVVPDLGKVLENYRKSGDADVFCREFYGFDKDKVVGVTRKAIRGHEWMYDAKSMIKILKKVGFGKVIVSEWGKSSMPDIKKLDLSWHRELGLYLEATKI